MQVPPSAALLHVLGHLGTRPATGAEAGVQPAPAPKPSPKPAVATPSGGMPGTAVPGQDAGLRTASATAAAAPPVPPASAPGKVYPRGSFIDLKI